MLIFDLNDLNARNKDFVLWWWENNHEDSFTAAVGMLSACVQIPCVKVAYWIAEQEGWKEEHKVAIDKIVAFYDYKLINVPTECPWHNKEVNDLPNLAHS